MSGPTIGIGRIDIPYTFSGLTHHIRMYVDNPTLSGATWVIGLRPSVGGTVGWTAAVDDFLTNLTGVLGSGVTLGTAILEEYFATGWVPRDTYLGTLGTLAGSFNPAAQLTVTLRDENFTRPKIVMMEPNQVAPAKYTNPTAGPGGLDTFLDGFLPGGSGGSRPYNVMVNQHGFFLSDSPFISARLTFNRKLERARGLA